MKSMNITGDYSKLEQIYIQKIINISNEIGFSYLVWQEVFDNNVMVSGTVLIAYEYITHPLF